MTHKDKAPVIFLVPFLGHRIDETKVFYTERP